MNHDVSVPEELRCTLFEVDYGVRYYSVCTKQYGISIMTCTTSQVFNRLNQEGGRRSNNSGCSNKNLRSLKGGI